MLNELHNSKLSFTLESEANVCITVSTLYGQIFKEIQLGKLIAGRYNYEPDFNFDEVLVFKVIVNGRELISKLLKS